MNARRFIFEPPAADEMSRDYQFSAHTASVCSLWVGNCPGERGALRGFGTCTGEDTAGLNGLSFGSSRRVGRQCRGTPRRCVSSWKGGGSAPSGSAS